MGLRYLLSACPSPVLIGAGNKLFTSVAKDVFVSNVLSLHII
jgi:hypothetical protein